MTKKHELFCQEYIIDFNATRAYAKVYNRKNDETSRVDSARLLTNANIQKYIAKLVKPIIDKLGVDVEYVIMNIKEIQEDKTSNKHERLKALELLGKYLKLFTDKVDITGELKYRNIQIKVNGKIEEIEDV